MTRVAVVVGDSDTDGDALAAAALAVRAVDPHAARLSVDDAVSLGTAGDAAADATPYDVALVDWRAAGADAAVARLAELGAAVVALGAAERGADAAAAFAAGAESVVPADGREALEGALRRAAEKARLRQAVRESAGRRVWPAASAALAGASPAMRDVAAQLEWAASADAPLLLLGEPGSEKAQVAELVHGSGPRAYEPFVALRCADGSAALAAGDVAAAVGSGTIYLDEVASLDAAAQRALYTLATTAGPRVIAATQADLATEVGEGRFHEALYYALSSVAVYLPPLRARTRDDVRAAVDAVIGSLDWEPPSPASEAAASAVESAALERLLAYAWPGNLRELHAVLDRAASLARSSAIGVAHLPAELRGADPAAAPAAARSLEEVERAHIERALRERGGNRTHAARDLGIARATLIKKIKAYGLGARAYGAGRVVGADDDA